MILYSFITRNTIGGRHIYAVGGNRLAATLSGVKDRRVDFFVMMNMSVLASLAGMIFVARATASGPQDGNGWELDAIASVFIGGAAVSGGIGTVIGSIVGGLVMAFLNNGLQLIGAGADLVQIIKGLVLLIAVGVDVWSKRQGRPSILGIWSQRRKARAAADEPVLESAGHRAPHERQRLGRVAAPLTPPQNQHHPSHHHHQEKVKSMKKIALATVAVAAAAALALSGCSSDRGGSTGGSTRPPRASLPTPPSASPSPTRPRRTGFSPVACSRTA